MKIDSAVLRCGLIALAGVSLLTAQVGSNPGPHMAMPARVASDLSIRLARLKPVHMPFDTASLSQREVAEVNELVAAMQLLDDIYWRQIDPQGLDLYRQLTKSDKPPVDIKQAELAKYLFINGSRFDIFHDNQPFVGMQPIPPGRAFYASGMTQAEIDKYVAAHPNQKTAIYSSTMVVKREGTKLVTVPYRAAYVAQLQPAAEHLRKAAALSPDPAFAKFLRARADALLNDDYFPSDLLWMDLESPKIDIIYAPYETYNDELLGVKGSFGGAVMVRNDAESKKLELFQKYVADIQDALPVKAEYRPSKHGKATPMEVVDTPYRAGDLRHGYQAVADNLPNNPKVHQEKGTKKMFFKNFMDARVNEIVLPTAKQMMEPRQAALASGEGYLAAVMMHEICHGLGPDVVIAQAGRPQRNIGEAIGPGYASLEEAKADVVGMFGLDWLMEKGALPAKERSEYYASYVAGIFRTVRFGAAEAHSRAEMMEFNYLVEQGAVVRNAEGRYEVNEARLPGAIASLSKELLEIEASGDRARNDAWFAKYGTMPPELKDALDKVQDVPVDFEPVFDFGENPK